MSFASALIGNLQRRFSSNNVSDRPQDLNNSSFLSSRPSSRSSSKQESINLDPPPLTPVELHGYNARTKSRLLNSEIAEEIRALLPARHQLYDTWNLVYSLEQHGASLNTLYSNSQPQRQMYGSEGLTQQRNGYVLIVRDRNHNKFGAYVNEPFHSSPTAGSRRYYGNGDCFLWSITRSKVKTPPEPVDKEQKLIDDNDNDDNDTKDADDSDEGYELQFKGYPYTGVNDFVIYSTPQFLSLGGGDGHYGLWLDSNLEHGVSHHSLTFGNDPLNGSTSPFDIIGVEVWRIG